MAIDDTSGTTARPKGVEQTYRARWTNAVVRGWQLGISDRDVYLSVVPMVHCDAWGMPCTLVAMGVKTVVVRKVDGLETLRRVRDHGITLTCGSPSVCTAVPDAAAKWDRATDGDIPGRGRMPMVVAGAPPPTRAIERMVPELGWEFIQIYGLAERALLWTMSRQRAEWDDPSPRDHGAPGVSGAPRHGSGRQPHGHRGCPGVGPLSEHHLPAVLDQRTCPVEQFLHHVLMSRRLAWWPTDASCPNRPRWPISRRMFVARAASRHTSALVSNLLEGRRVRSRSVLNSARN
jgi:acyl-CoA synthetase (AMP-forming)/AMP-acid ligase II